MGTSRLLASVLLLATACNGGERRLPGVDTLSGRDTMSDGAPCGLSDDACWDSIIKLQRDSAPQPPDSGKPEVKRQTSAQPMRYSFAYFAVTPGDTLTYTARWPAWRYVSGYKYWIRASPSTNWTLPTGVTVKDTTVSFRVINTSGWDSVSFRLVVKGLDYAGATTRDSVYVNWKVVRPPVPGGPPTVDSSKVVSAIIIKPDAVRMVKSDTACTNLSLAQRIDTLGRAHAKCQAKDSAGVVRVLVVQFCAFAQTLDGKYRMLGPIDATNRNICRRRYDSLPAAGRLSGYPVLAATDPPGHTFKVVIQDNGDVSRPELELDLVSPWSYYIDHQMSEEVANAIFRSVKQ